MAEPFLSEIRIMSFGFAPRGWALCNGQTLPINQNQALFSLLGTTYGGNGQTTFQLPNLQARVPIHVGSSFTLGQAGGQTAHTLTMSEMPQHAHVLNASSSDANQTVPGGKLFAKVPQQIYAPAANFTPLEPTTVRSVGGSQPHTNQQPFLTLNFSIALQGIFPSPN
jgi:microcystin-dependent protein